MLQDFTYMQINILDSPNASILQHVEDANKFIRETISVNEEGKPPVHKLLIHCFAGKSRATSFLVAYLVKERKISVKDCMDRIWKVRPIAAPNPGFMIQLKALERATLGSVSECEVMQGAWKEKLEALKKVKEEKAAAGEVVSPIKLQDKEYEDELLENAAKQHEGIMKTTTCEKTQDPDLN